MVFLAQIISWLISAYIWIIIIEIIIHWLLIFGVMNTKNPQAKNLVNLLSKATHPVMSRVRQYIPPIGGFDLTPVVVIFGLSLLRMAVWKILVI